MSHPPHGATLTGLWRGWLHLASFGVAFWWWYLWKVKRHHQVLATGCNRAMLYEFYLRNFFWLRRAYTYRPRPIGIRTPVSPNVTPPYVMLRACRRFRRTVAHPTFEHTLSVRMSCPFAMDSRLFNRARRLPWKVPFFPTCVKKLRGLKTPRVKRQCARLANCNNGLSRAALVDTSYKYRLPDSVFHCDSSTGVIWRI